jgi:hypothetical protein
LEVGLVEADD